VTVDTNRIVTGDAFDVLPTLPDDSIHACVTDPPYGLAFMGRDWDDFDPKEYQNWCEQWAEEVRRVLKPGGHLLSFSGNRTHHRPFTGIEDGGFEIRDTLTWHYGSGFPKATDVSKTIDKRADAEREVVGVKNGNGVQPGHGNYVQNDESDWNGEGFDKTNPATDAAKRWDGWKTGLKPATEYVVVARKPFDGTTTDCVQKHGTGALNIDGARVGDESLSYTVTNQRGGHVGGDNSRQSDPVEQEGRYPANVCFGEDAPDRDVPTRFFYTSKASASERSHDGRIDNDHPTVKPVDLCEWLITLVTCEGQTVVDPFCGSGTIPLAARDLSREFIGIERDAGHADVSRARCGLEPHDPSRVAARDDG